MPLYLRKFLLTALTLALFTAACSSSDSAGETDPSTDTDTSTDIDAAADAEGPLTIYSGRSEELVAPVLELFTAETGIEVEVRYGDTAEMAALVLEEGDNSPADVYFGQDAGALGALSSGGTLAAIPSDLLDRVPEALRSPDGEWVGVSGRARVVVYNPTLVAEDELPDSILDFSDPVWKGRIGWAPTNGSMQAFVTALRVLIGEDEAKAWLEGIVANEPVVFDGNSPVVEAVAAGEIEVGFVNHYYALQMLAENPDLAVANKYFTNGDPGGLVNVAGVGVIRTSDQPGLAEQFVDFMLSTTAQEYFASETYEIPLVEGVEQDPAIPNLDTATLPEIDLDQLEDLAGTLELLTEVGAL